MFCLHKVIGAVVDNLLCIYAVLCLFLLPFQVAPLKDGKRELENTHELLCPAGGYIVVTGAYNSFSYKSYDAEHNIF